MRGGSLTATSNEHDHGRKAVGWQKRSPKPILKAKNFDVSLSPTAELSIRTIINHWTVVPFDGKLKKMFHQNNATPHNETNSQQACSVDSYAFTL